MEKGINQERLLEFITKALTKIEGEPFFIKRVNLCSQYYTFLPSEIVVGHMYIIGNSDYFKKTQTLFNSRNNCTDYQYISCVHGDSKAFLLRYNYRQFNESSPYKFKLNKLIDDTDYANIAAFPYLT